ncbi:hypothetical protein PCASD_02426 [Puccinia coronata f. sp. avenae]|nr:hypothetical protein PCASD_19690 [Puccinia coronata f. sp. avenae]PLW51028.1 hypothetical protein PCASD_02426 [Puccinia coronata f. sp. avenae]
MAFLGLSLVTWQTLLIIAFPLIYGSFSRIRAVLLFIRHPLKSMEARRNDQTTTSRVKDKGEETPPARRYWRLQTVFLGVIIVVHCVRFMGENPRASNPFRLTKQLLNVPSSTLATSLERYYRSQGLKEMPAEQERLIRKLNTLDARLLYSTLGPAPFLGCSWCRPPSSKANGSDHLYFSLARLGFEYASLLLVVGLMTTGASQLNTKRRVWRARLGFLTMFVFVFEAVLLSLLVRIPSLLTAMDSARMTWDALFLFRSALFALFFLAAWWAVVSEPPRDLLTPSAKLGFGLAALASDLDSLVNRLRLTALQRTALMKDGDYRTRIQQFWEKVERQATQASSSASIESLKDTMGLSASEMKNHEARDQLRTWIDNVYPDPSLSLSASPSPNPPSL